MYHIRQRATGFYYHGSYHGVPIFVYDVRKAKIFCTPAGELREILESLNSDRAGWCEIGIIGNSFKGVQNGKTTTDDRGVRSTYATGETPRR